MNMYLTLQNPKTRVQNALKIGWTDILFISLWLGISLSAWAQPQYNFTAVSGTFTPITGGTSAGINSDDAISATLPIGFTFVYNGISYTQFRASSNGWMTFSTTATDLAGNGLSGAAAARRPLLAPLWDDIDGGFGGTPAPAATYKTEGTVGSRILTMEWLNWGWNWNANVPVISFQVKLYEATGVIEYIYQQESGAINTGSGGASIGLTTATGTGANTYISLSDASAAPTTSSTTETTTILTKPATGQIYRWTPTFTPVRTLSPANSATGVALTSNLTIGFAYPATPPTIGTGTIELRKTTGGTLVESFTLPSPRVTVSGNNVVIDPTNPLECTTQYYITVPATAIGGVGFTGITTTTAWAFTTTAPALAGYSYTTIPVNFENIATSGTVVTFNTTNGDGITGTAITMPTAFPYFGANYTQLKVAADGWITFDVTRTTGDFSNSTIPDADGAPLMIAPFWDDLDADVQGTVRTQDMGTYFLVSYHNVPRFLSTDGNNFQIKLFYATGVIELHYGTMGTTTLNSATVGIENATQTTGGLLINFNGTGDALGSDRAFRIIPPPTALPLTATFTPTNGATGVAQNANLVLNFDYPVQVGTGNIEIVNATTSAVLETIPVGDARVDYSTVGQVTINPATDFPAGAVIAVRFPAGAFKSCNNINVAGITNTTDWRFTVINPCATLAINAGPDQTGVASGSDVTLAGVAATGGSGNYTYAWTPTTGLSDPTILNPVASNVTATITYTLTVTDVTTTCTKADGVSILLAPVGGGGGGGSTPTVVAPSVRITSVNSTSLRLNWTGGDAENYTIYRSASAFGNNYTRVGQVAGTASTYLDSMLMPNTQYFYYVQAVRGSTFANSNIVSDFTYPSAPRVASFQNACLGTGAQLNVKGSTGLYSVYSAATGGTAVVSGDSSRVITTPTFADSTTFYVSAIGARYESTPRVAVRVITRPLPTATMLGAATQESCTDTLTIMAEAVTGATYTWYSSDAPLATTSTPMYTVNRSGVYSVLVNKEGCVARSNTIIVRVNQVSPAQIRGLDTRQFCEVGTLNAVETAGASYEWQNNNTVVGTGSSLEVTQSGSYTVTVTSALGCVLTSTPVTVTVINIPQLDLQSSAPDFCEGTDGVELTVNSVSGASYEWLRNGRRIRTTSSPSLQVNVGAEYSVRVVVNGCSRTSDPITVVRNAAPAASVRVYGDSIKVVYVGSVEIESISWTKDDAPFAATTQAFAPTESGLYVATVTYATGCQVVTSGVNYIKRPEPPVVVGEEEVEALGFMLFPNPTASKVNLTFGDAFKGDITLTLTDAIGRTIQVVKVKASENATLDLSTLANGNYMLTIASNDKVVTRKIIRE